MRRLCGIVSAFALLLLVGCYAEESSPAPAAGPAGDTAQTPSSPGSTRTTGDGADRGAGSTLGAAKRSAQNTVDRAQAASAETARQAEDPE